TRLDLRNSDGKNSNTENVGRLVFARMGVVRKEPSQAMHTVESICRPWQITPSRGGTTGSLKIYASVAVCAPRFGAGAASSAGRSSAKIPCLMAQGGPSAFIARLNTVIGPN